MDESQARTPNIYPLYESTHMYVCIYTAYTEKCSGWQQQQILDIHICMCVCVHICI